jgi:hypothetical protein
MVVKLRTEVFNELSKKHYKNDVELAKKMGISTTQLWRVRLPEEDPRHNDPGTDFVAGALKAFGNTRFEDLFFLDKPLRERNAALSLTGTDNIRI